MSDDRSAPGGARFEGIATIEEQPGRGMITLRGDLSSAAIRKVARQMAGLDLPGPLECRIEGERWLGWMAPDEALMILPRGEVAAALAAAEGATAGAHATLVDVSEARVSFRVSGPCAREVLAKLTPVDLSADAFTTGSLRRTRLGQVAVAIWQDEPGVFGLICFRSVARYVFELMSDAAKEGAAVGYFPAGA